MIVGDDMLIPPAKAQRARFAPGYGPAALLTVDTEEEFDWHGEFHADAYRLDHVLRLSKFQEFCEGLGVVPVYLVDWPIANSRLAEEILGSAVRRGTAELGIQLHPWVNPPHDEVPSAYTSYAGNLPPDLMRAKFHRLLDAIMTNFQSMPQVYRAGRYGLGPHTAQMLIDTGIPIDSSVRSLFDYRAGHGPDFSRHPADPYWVDRERRLLELPLTSVHTGMLRRQGRALYPLACKLPRLPGLLARTALLERIALTPEGVAVGDTLRGIDIALDDGLPLLVFSFHSPSLSVGNTPYVRTEEELDALYDWLRAVYAYLDMRGVRSTTIAEVVRNVAD